MAHRKEEKAKAKEERKKEKEKRRKEKEIEKEVKDPTTVNNSLFIGSTAELQELLNKKK